MSYRIRRVEASAGWWRSLAQRLAAKLPLIPGFQSAVKWLALRGVLPRRAWTHLPPIGVHRLEPFPGISFLYGASVTDQLARSIVWTNLRDWEFATVLAFVRLAPSSRAFIDVGAYSGIYSVLVSAANPRIKVIAIEPNRSLFPLLQRNLQLNHVRGEARWAGAGAESGRSRLVVPPDTTTAHLVKADDSPCDDLVPVGTLDQVAASLGPVDLLKIDVEGSELDVLDGARRLLREHHPRIVIEALTAARAGEITELLRSFDYSSFVSLLPDGPALLADSRAHDPRHPNILCSVEAASDLMRLIS